MDRLGSYIKKTRLDIPTPEWYVQRIRSIIGDEDMQIVLDVINTIIDDLTKCLKEYASKVKAMAEEKGESVTISRSCCHEERCGTCLGAYKNHFPVWRRYNGEWGKSKVIRSRELADFLRKYLDEDEVQDYFILCDLRNRYLAFMNYWCMSGERLGLIERVNHE